MLASGWLIAWTLTAAPIPSVHEATRAIAAGESADQAVERLKQAGKPGLWALCDAAKNAHGAERGRLFEAIGAIGTAEAEWALVIELKGGEPEGVAGSVRGLARIQSGSSCGAIVRQAGAKDAQVRDAVAGALVAKKGCGPATIRRLWSSTDELEREMAVRYVVDTHDPMGAELTTPSLADPSALVRYQGAALAADRHDRTQLYTLADLARGSDERLAVRAARAIAEVGGFGSPGELGAVIADHRTTEGAWREAGRALRTLGKEGFGALVRGISRSKDPARRAALADMASHNLSEVDLLAAVELLEDAEFGVAGALILDRAGERGRAAASARRATALPELDQAIEHYLSAVRALPAAAEGLVATTTKVP
jgi:HEAT repeat protein